MYHCFVRFVALSFFIFSTLVVAVIADAQSHIDSLKLLVAEEKKGSDKIDRLIELAIAQISIANDSSLSSINDAYKLALEIGDSGRIVYAGRIKGEILKRKERINESIKVLTELLSIARRNNFKNDLKYILNSLAIDYTFQANYDKALDYHFQSLIIREANNDKPAISITLNNIGIVYFKLGDFEKAIEYYKRSLFLKKEIRDPYDLDRLLINIGLSYNHLKDFKNARRFIQDGLKACGSDCSQQIKIEGQIGFGISYFEEHNYNEAKNHFVESYNIAKTEGNKRFQLENLLYLARIYIDEEDHSKAQSYLTQAESIASETEYNQLFIDIYREFSRLYNQTKDFERATYYQGRYIHLKDSIYSADLIKNLASVQTNFEERENKAIIAVNEETISRQRKLNFAIGVIAVLSLLLIWVLYHSNKVKKKVNNALSEAKNFIELKNKELDKKVAEKTADLEVANESLRKVNDELDNFIYKTSHDIRGPLASLKGICNVALLDVHDPVALSYLDKLDVTAEHLNTILTRLLIINQINNSAIKTDAVNFESVVEEVLLLEHKKGLPPRLVIKKTIDPELEFYCDKEFIRIILENLIDNAIKFFNDSDRIDPFVDIRIEKDGNDIKIRVIDNGIGISEAKPDKIFQMFSRASERSSTGGIGLYITKTATEKIGGHIGLRTTPEGYTEFYVKFPIKRSWFSEHLTND